MKTVTFAISDELTAQLDEIAEENLCSRSVIIRQFLAAAVSGKAESNETSRADHPQIDGQVQLA